MALSARIAASSAGTSTGVPTRIHTKPARPNSSVGPATHHPRCCSAGKLCTKKPPAVQTAIMAKPDTSAASAPYSLSTSQRPATKRNEAPNPGHAQSSNGVRRMNQFIVITNTKVGAPSQAGRRRRLTGNTSSTRAKISISIPGSSTVAMGLNAYSASVRARKGCAGQAKGATSSGKAASATPHSTPCQRPAPMGRARNRRASSASSASQCGWCCGNSKPRPAP